MRTVSVWALMMLASSICTHAPAATAFGQNLLVNSDFEMGNTGFASTYTCSPGSHYLPEGHYDVLTNPRADHPLGASFGDHTTGSGFMLAVNGAPKAKAVVWGQIVDVAPNTTYLLSGWVSSWAGASRGFDSSPAVLRILINGQPCAADVHLIATNGLWQRFDIVWHSQSATQAAIEIHDQNTEWRGNDFALDDLSFSAVSAGQASPVLASPILSPAFTSDASSQVSSPEPKPLESDKAFGFALPAGIRLTHQIDASTDLTSWAPATNVSLFFKDLDSTNYDHRFYRFEKR